jgi:NADPH-dependent ferric siderophore reductase
MITRMSVADTPPTPQPSRLSRALVRLFMKHAHIVEAEPVADNFRLITLASPEFIGLQWMAGQKLQIAMGSAFAARTFTPIEWDATAGRTRILGYAHGKGPGSAWICSTGPGAECDVFGPRSSLAVSPPAGMCVVFGDETSLGLAYALARQSSAGSRLLCLIEVNALAPARNVLTRLDLDGVELFERTQHDSHLDIIEQRLRSLAASDATFVLTGNASSIQRLRRTLKALGVPPAQLPTKPYWATGKTGLD